MFKSKFANALTTMMIGSLGIAAAQNNFLLLRCGSWAYGSAGAENVWRYCQIRLSLPVMKNRVQFCVN